ncbi:MAG: type II toxin-antitoxin system Phd/YefM family antitoxin [Myxococcaceae bacterium]
MPFSLGFHGDEGASGQGLAARRRNGYCQAEVSDMEHLTVRALSRETAAALDRVERGETIEVTRGKRVVAKIEPVRRDEERKLRWKEHIRWLQDTTRSRAGPKMDPVDELLSERDHRNEP